jgi:hypothetical protein
LVGAETFFACHPERSEGSNALEKARFFAEFILSFAEGLRMTLMTDTSRTKKERRDGKKKASVEN